MINITFFLLLTPIHYSDKNVLCTYILISLLLVLNIIIPACSCYITCSGFTTGCGDRVSCYSEAIEIQDKMH